ncbi:MAG: MoaD/ThiS family protein [Flavobacterium sp.]|nr:MoaD/ThiS family protein [Flavobacterium sp.]
MQINLKYFGLVADHTKKKDEVIFFEGNSITLLEVQTRLHQTYPELTTTTYSFAVNQMLIQGEASVNNLDEIALLPPFAGG